MAESMKQTLLLLLILSTCSAWRILPIAEAEVLQVPRDYSSIQLAVDAANPGDVVKVASGTYVENVRIDKELTLLGEDPANTVLAANGTIVKVVADNVEISGFAVRGGIYGIYLYYSSGTRLRNNTMSNNKWNFAVWGNALSHYVHDVDSTNFVDGKPVYFWTGQHNKQVPEDAGFVGLVSSTNITVKNLELTSNEQGVLLVNTNSSTVENTQMRRNDEGIVLRMSHNNTLKENKLFSVNFHGFYLVASTNNLVVENTIIDSPFGLVTINGSNENVFHHNNFINNTVQLYSETSQNTWHNQAEQGNYWSDYEGQDLDGDNVGDTMLPHQKVDNYPLTKIQDTVSPVASAGENRTVYENTQVDFDAAKSTDNIVLASFHWDFGDGSSGTGMAQTHIYTQTGNVTVTLTVKDLAGNTAHDTITIMVVAAPTLSSQLLVIAAISLVLFLASVVVWLTFRRSVRLRRLKEKKAGRNIFVGSFLSALESLQFKTNGETK